MRFAGRSRGTPQSGVISPLLANLFLHYAFDVWLGRAFPGVPFERYADDIICHCRGERESLALLQVLDRRFANCGLVSTQRRPGVYCKDTPRTGDAATIQFDFLGYTVSGRGWRSGGAGCSVCPICRPPVPPR